MTINELKSKIESLNEQVKELNLIRERNLSKKEMLTESFNKSCKEYKDRYGKEITADNVKEELELVANEKQEEVEKVEKVIGYIKAGDINSANKLLGVVEEEKPVVNQQQPVTNTQQYEKSVYVQPAVEPQPTVSDIPQVVVQQDTQEINRPTVMPPIFPQTVTPATPIEEPVYTAPQPIHEEPSQQDDMPHVAPPSFSKPKEPVNAEPQVNINPAGGWGAILNNTPFSPQ